MRITQAKQKNAKYLYLYLEGEYALAAHTEAFASMGLKEGMEITPEQLEELKARTDTIKAREKAYQLLSYRDYSKKELTDKLGNKVDYEVAEMVTDRIEELGYLNDEEYARKLVRSLSREKMLSERSIRRELSQKGIPAELAEEAMGELEEDDVARILRLIHRKFERKLGDDAGVRRVYAALLRRGYSYGDVRTALQQYLEEENWQEELPQE